MVTHKIILIILLKASFLMSQILDEKLYITIQMMDQVCIINTENNQIEYFIENFFKFLQSTASSE